MSVGVPQPKERKLFFSKQVTQDTIVELLKSIVEINEDDQKLKKLAKLNGFRYKPKPIKIYIDSYGGQVYQCFGLLSVMNASSTPIHTIVTGCAMSCGFLIAIHGHKRFCLEHSRLLYHQVSGGTIGKVADMEEAVVKSKALQKDIEKMVLQKTKITKERLQQAYKQKEDWVMKSKEALELECIDEILTQL